MSSLKVALNLGTPASEVKLFYFKYFRQERVEDILEFVSLTLPFLSP
jgi:hypothetical protein